jgi:Flp pilus assembly protein TadG
MKHRHFSRMHDERGIAAVEFALVAPVLLMILGGIADFGLLMVGKSQLSDAVGQGIQYALASGPSVAGATVRNLIQAAAPLAGLVPTVTATVTGPACYCTSGTPVALVTPSTALTGSYTCTGTCAGSGVAPGAYIIVTATYSYQPIMPFYSNLSTTTVSETATARLQ